MAKLFVTFILFLCCLLTVSLPGGSFVLADDDTQKDSGGVDEDEIGEELTQADVEGVTLEDGDPETGLDSMDEDGNLTQANAEEAALESGGNEAILDTVAGDETVTRADAEAAQLGE